MQHRAFARSERYSLARMVDSYQGLYAGLIDGESDTVIPFPNPPIEASP
jgi:hypothetical protein